MKYFLILGLFICALLITQAQLVGPAAPRTTALGGNLKFTAAGGTPSFVEFITNNAGNATGQSFVLTNDMTAGDTLVVGVYWESASATVTMSDTSGDSFGVYTNVNVAGALFCEMWVAKNCAAGTAVKTTIDLGASKGSVTTVAWRISGASATAPVDQRAVGSDGGSAGGGITGTVTTTQAIEVLCYLGANFSSVSSTPQAGWTEYRDSNGVEFQTFTSSIAGNYFGTNDWSISDAMIAAMLTIK